MDNLSPLVSVFIVTYNSQDYIIEALESVKSQTYQNIELVISDDCSKDDTVEIVKKWISKNGERFVRTEIVEAPVNTGTSGNYNRAVRACRGEWLKMLDGDDMLTPNCVEDNIDYISTSPSAQVIFSNYFRFKDNYQQEKHFGEMSPKADMFFCLSQKEQARFLLAGNILPSQTCFIKSELLKLHQYNEQYPLLEDYPMWVHLLDIGVPFYYFNKITALYRQEDSVSSRKDVLFPLNYLNICKLYFENDLLPLIIKYNANEAYDYHTKYFKWSDFCIRYLNNKKNCFTIICYWLSKFIIFKCMKFKLK